MNPKPDLPLQALEKKREELINAYLNGNEPDFLKKHTGIIDDYFHARYETSAVGPLMDIRKNPYAIIALGGYGRGEQCIHSDIDLLFLFEKKVPKPAGDLVREIIYPMWDMGFEVGYATRSLKDCIEVALDDVEVLTALLDARFICGISFLYSKLMELLRKNFVNSKSRKVMNRLIERNHERHIKFGDSSFLLEPNLKEGHGGLRDYHTILWVAKIRNQLCQPRDLEYYGRMSHDEFERLKNALSFIWDVRNRLHDLCGRKCDQLRFRHQEKLAEIMKFGEKNGQQPVERFLEKLHRHMSFLKNQEKMCVYEIENEKFRKQRKKINLKTAVAGLTVKKGMLYFTSSERINADPALLMEIFRQSAVLKIPLGAESKRLVTEFLHLADKNYICSGKAREAFEDILLIPVKRFNVLEAMLETGLLIKYIPGFENIVDRIQYDEYHLYPVDKHMLRTVQVIKKFGTEDDVTKNSLCADIYEELERESRLMLLWAALLHDIGKAGPGGSHAIKGEKTVRKILLAKGYSKDFADGTAFLVREHLFLIKTATRRDIQDEETAIFCAKKIENPGFLKMLYLLTVADSASTGPKAWNDWTASLAEGLFLNVLATLENGELTNRQAIEVMEKKKAALIRSAKNSRKQKKELEYLLNVMSPRYLLYANANDMKNHIALYKTLGDNEFAWDIKPADAKATRNVTICAKDRPGLISKIAGVFTLHNINILDVQIFTWRNHMALDLFKVEPPLDRVYEDKKWDRAKKDLEAALSGKLDLEKALKEKIKIYGQTKPKGDERPDKIVINNKNSSFFTIIEVFTYDFPGLLYAITNALFNCRLDVWVAKIATKVDQVVDVFYVRDFDGQKVYSDDHVKKIEKAIKEVLANGPFSKSADFPESGVKRP